MACSDGANRFTPEDSSVRESIEAATGRSLLVEAAAGTGKTTLIVDRILRGVLDGSLRMRATVAITFTEKAAGELEERLRRRLAEAAENETLSERERSRVRRAFDELDRAHISTIHSFCSGILREKPVEAGVDPQFSVMDETPSQLLMRDCWTQWMDRQVEDSPAVLVRLLQAGARMADLRGLAWALANAPEVMESLPDLAGRINADPTGPIRDLCVAAADALPVFEAYMRRGGNQHSRELQRLAALTAAPGAADGDTLVGLGCRIGAIDADRALKSIAKDHRDEAGPLLSRLVEVGARIGARLAWNALGWLSGFVEEYAAAKRRHGALDFQDLLVLAARLLRDRPDVRRYFQGRFDAFFVDEFQDTDPLQAELIAYLCERPGSGPAAAMRDVRLADGKLVAVGDPKQSIYRFRRADVQVYEAFKDLFRRGSFAEERVERLWCNFRSGRRLLEWLNRAFESVFGVSHPEGVVQAEPVDLVSGRAPTAGEGASVVAFCPPIAPPSEWNAEVARRHEAHYLALAVKRAVEHGECLPTGDSPLAYGDFAFLFRALTDVDVYQDALERYGVPCRVVGSKHFYRREQVNETLAVIRAVDDPLDEAAVVGALRSSFFGFSDEDLFRFRERGGRWNYLYRTVEEGPVAGAMEQLLGWHRRSNRVPPHVLLARIFDETKAVQAFQVKPAGDQRAANLEKLLSDLRELGRLGRTFGACVRHLSELGQAELPESESAAVEPGGDFVQLLSMHKAKGLEFPAVVLPDLSRRFAGKQKLGSLLLDRMGGRQGFRVRGGIETESYARMAEDELANQIAEEHRLLYVACTRARRLLVLSLYWRQGKLQPCYQTVLEGCGCVVDAESVPYGEERDGVLYYDTRPLISALDLAARPRDAVRPDDADADALVERRLQWTEDHRRLAAAASAAEPCVVPSALGHAAESDKYLDDGMEDAGGRDIGTLFHNLVGTIPVDELLDSRDDQIAVDVAAAEAVSLGLSEAFVGPVTELLRACRGNAEFVALLSEAETVRREVPFTVPLAEILDAPPVGGGFTEGSIDLLARTADGTAIVDFKTDRVAPDRLQEAADRYWPQLALYALAAEACGWCDGDLQLALFFVRAGRLLRRSLDDDLRRRVRALVHERISDGVS